MIIPGVSERERVRMFYKEIHDNQCGYREAYGCVCVCVRACHSMCVCVRVITHVVLVFFHIPELGVSIKLLDGLQLNLFFANTKSR